ncbi:MAG: PrsW family glutamic-type intramembrane protease [Candidatus Gracilibacteria bacterium]|nr:PrsW family glutamic-type intramembrane protease [Candidatus Gracilibacteria bacterium]
MDIIYTFLIIVISFLPILLWAYVFSYFDNSALSRTRFVFGLGAGIISVVPILYFSDLINSLSLPFLNVFSALHNISTFSSSFFFFASIFSFFSFLLVLSLFAGLVSFYKQISFKNLFILYLKNLFYIASFLALSSAVIYVLNLVFSQIPFFSNTRDLGVNFGDIAFSSLKLIIFYYILVGIIEELSKYLGFFSSSFLYIKTVRTGVLYAVFVALGFSLAENILYFKNIFDNVGLNGQLVTTYFFRSIFSVILHVLCSFIVAYYFSQALIKYRNLDIRFPYIKVFFSGLLVAIILHMIFDIALTFGFTFFIFLYLIGAYLYITGVFYKELNENN